MKRYAVMVMVLVLSVMMFSCGKQSPYADILDDYTGQMEEKTAELVEEAKSEVTPGGPDSYTVYIEKINELQELSSAGKSEMSDIYYEDPENQDEDDLLEHLDLMEDLYGSSCAEVAEACGVDE